KAAPAPPPTWAEPGPSAAWPRAGQSKDDAGTGPEPKLADRGLGAQLGTLGRALHASPMRRPVALLAAGIAIVVFANTLGLVRLNTWQGGFYDAINARNL